MALCAEAVCKRFFRKNGESNFFEAVHPTTLDLVPGTVTILTGRSGSGKTTLLHMLAGLLSPTDGKVLLDGKDLYAFGDAELSRIRGREIALIPQGRSLLDSLTVYENILLPDMMWGGQPKQEEGERWMEELRISDLKNAFPAELSGGELRRAAIARALTAAPRYLLADEPTGDLDDENTKNVLSIFQSCAREFQMGVCVVTHESDAIAYGDQVYRMDAGLVTKSDQRISPGTIIGT